VIDLRLEPYAAISTAALRPVGIEILKDGINSIAETEWRCRYFVIGPGVMPGQTNQDGITVLGLNERDQFLPALLELFCVNSHGVYTRSRRNPTRIENSGTKI